MAHATPRPLLIALVGHPSPFRMNWAELWDASLLQRGHTHLPRMKVVFLRLQSLQTSSLSCTSIGLSVIIDSVSTVDTSCQGNFLEGRCKFVVY